MFDCTFVILGATGDLTKRKLIPAIYKLVQDKRITNFAIVGVAITKTTMQAVIDEAEQFIDAPNAAIWQSLKERSYYSELDFHNSADYDTLLQLLNDVEKKHSLSGNRIFYLATLPQHFAVITENLSKTGIVQKSSPDHTPWTRIVYEKPFGFDLASARAINAAITKLFNEDQIYRIDHYLGKELVGNIALLRFTNRVFEPQWCATDIESVQIIMNETIGLEGRGAFYDNVGAVNDMVQSHMLQILALVAMEAPEHLSGNYIRDAKAAVLKAVRPQAAVFGQYEGYRSEPQVQTDSQTETFAAIKLYIDNPRWKDVPFYLKTGKYLHTKETSIHLKFREVKCLLNKDCPADTNYLTIKVDPDEGFYLEINAKVPGEAYTVMPVIMDFRYKNLFGPNTPQAYETLLFDVMRGDQSVFLREDEIELSWQIVEKILQMKQELYEYPKASSGPSEIKQLDTKKPIRWRS